MPDSEPPSDSPAPLRIAPNLDLEHTKLNSTGNGQRGPGDEPVSLAGAGLGQAPSRGGGGAAPSDPAPPRLPGPEPRPDTTYRALWFLVLAACALIVSLVVKELRGSTPRPAASNSFSAPRASSGSLLAPSPEDVVAGAIGLESDGLGRTTMILGDDPASVLEAYCADARWGEIRRPVGVVDSLLSQPDSRIGVFENGAGEREAIRIRQDADLGRWFAGDGDGSIPVEDPPSRQGR